MKDIMKLDATNRVLGVVFVLALLGSVYLTYALFTKQFTDYRVVTLRADKAGLQLPSRADVKLRGKFVGEVLERSADDEGAQLTLGLYAEDADLIPENVTGALVPKTLFGEKFVDLRIPESGPSNGSIQAGATISQVKLPKEIEDALESLFPLLRTVEPAQINFTLNALATALEGRGDQLGAGLVTTNQYLKRLNPELPQAIEDIRLLGGTSDVYASVLPELGTVFSNSVLTLGTLEERETELRNTLQQTAGLSGTLETFLDDNGDNLIAAGKLGRTQTRVLAKYSPAYPCFADSIVKFYSEYGGNWRGNTLHINLEPLDTQPRGYSPGDQATYNDKRGPVSNSDCRDAMNGRWNQQNPIPPRLTPDFADGVGSTGKGERPPGGGSRAGLAWSSDSSLTDPRPPTVFDDPSTSDLGMLLGSTVLDAQEVS